MQFKYDLESDMLYIRLTNDPSTESEEVAPGVALDFDAQNRVTGIEIEGASGAMDLSKLELIALPIADLVLTERAT
jgi:uncharacterized protein YuzE